MFCMILGGFCPSTNVGEGGELSRKILRLDPCFSRRSSTFSVTLFSGLEKIFYVKVTVNVYSRMSLDWLSMSFRLYVPF